MRRTQFCLGLLCAIVLGLLQTQSASGASPIDLHITVHGLRTAAGYLRLAVYDSGRDYLRVPVFKKNVAVQHEDLAGGMQLTMQLEAGEYAIAMYHDANGNGVFDKGLLGLPQEQYGFSNNVRPMLWAPSFEQVKFAVNRDHTALSIRVK